MKNIIKFILFIVIISLAILGVKYLFPDFYTRQVNKAEGVYYVDKADRALKAHKWQNAIDLYKKALSLYPEHYEAWHNLGSVYVLYEDYNSALEAYSNAIKYNPKFMIARMNYGIVSSEKLRDYNAAIEQYDEIIKTERKKLNIPYVFNNTRSTRDNKGFAYYNKGIAYKQKSLSLSQDDYVLRRKYLQEALDAYKSAVKILKNNYEAMYNMALTYHLLGNTREAGYSYCKAIALSPMSYEAHYNLAILLKHLHQYKESREELEKAAELITNSDGFSARQSYIFDVLAGLSLMMQEEDNSLVSRLDNEMDDTSQRVTYVKGKLVYTDDLDKAILKNFSTCKSFKIFQKELEDTEEDIVFRKKINIPE